MYLIHMEPFDSTNLRFIFAVYQNTYVAYNLVTGFKSADYGIGQRQVRWSIVGQNNPT